ncbi:MAG: hypothetical protein J6T86_04930 [Bacteroidales bacterium]|nr:hypothetical protein [Bacteroidales bacterium]
MKNIMDFWRNEWDAVADTSEVTESEQSNIKEVKIVVSSEVTGRAKTWSYPYDDDNFYEIPTYKLLLIGMIGYQRIIHIYNVLRFGVTRKTATSPPYVCGLADKQRHIIKQWIPTYKVHSAASNEIGAWQVYGNFLIHDGPDNPLQECYATVGCIEIFGGPQGFDRFNDDIIIFSGIQGGTRSEQLVRIGKSGKLVIEYEKADRPPLVSFIS